MATKNKKRGTTLAKAAQRNSATPNPFEGTPIQQPAQAQEDDLAAQPLGIDMARPSEEQLAHDVHSHGKGERRRNRGSQKPPLRDIDIESTLLNDPQRMNYILLLALLSARNGEAAFNQEQLEVDESAYNIVFARSLDGKKLVVSIVSAQSGILSAPGKVGDKMSQWQPSTPLTPQPLPGAGDERLPTRPQMLAASHVEPTTPQERFLLESLAKQPGPTETQGQPAATTERPMPSYPFEIGERPADTRPMPDLGAYARDANRSVQVEQSQVEIDQRVAREGR